MLNKPPVAVRTALQDLRSDALMEGYKFQLYYDEMLNKFPAMAEKYERPRLDRLYKSQCTHIGADCSQCPDDMLEARSQRKSGGSIVHYGTVGSADKVVRDPVLRDKLYIEEGVICFDLAAAGLMDGFECLIVRGISGKRYPACWCPAKCQVIAIPIRTKIGSLMPVQLLQHLPRSFC